MTPFGVLPKTGGSRFFPQPAMPVCAFTREEIDRRFSVTADTRLKALRAKRKLGLKSKPKGICGAAKIRWLDRFLVHSTEVVNLDNCAPMDAQAIRSAATMFGISVADLVSEQKTTLFAAARRYAAFRLYALGRTPKEIGALLHRHHSVIRYYLGLKVVKRGSHKPVTCPRRGLRLIRAGGFRA